LTCCVFDQVVLLSVIYDVNNKQILLSYAIVISETEDNWVWFDISWSNTSLGLVSLLQITLLGLIFSSAKVISEILDACLQDA
jgi:hypothetical protein